MSMAIQINSAVYLAGLRMVFKIHPFKLFNLIIILNCLLVKIVSAKGRFNNMTRKIKVQ